MSHYMIEKQKELMAKVPHAVRPDVYLKMLSGKKIVELTLLYLNSCGHKPWRSGPLDLATRRTAVNNIKDEWYVLYHQHLRDCSPDGGVPDHKSRQLISGLGVIEETIEYLNAVDNGSRAEQLEELTDVLFFYLEQAILGGFTWAEIEEEYVRKHAVNLKRYEDAQKGDYSWDKRGEGRL